MSHRILFVASHRPGRSPSQRFRFEQYLEILEEQGFECDLSWLISADDDRILYRPGHLLRKAGFAVRSQLRRIGDILRAGRYDVIFVQREATLFRGAWVESAFARSGARLLYDFDDAVWRPNVSAANRALGWLKGTDKIGRIIGKSDLVFAGNDYLADWARRFNPAVRVVPTTIDTDLYDPGDREDRPADAPVSIGWSGSLTTIPHFTEALPALRRVRARFGDRVTFRVVGDPDFRDDDLGIRGRAWSEETELDDLRAMDIGLMPLPDDEWARGKCGLKALQYMALEVPAVVSPVGVNTEIVTDGVNGIVAGDEDAWVEAISRLVEDADLRRRLGRAARGTVVERYSVASQAPVYLEALRALAEGRAVTPSPA